MLSSLESKYEKFYSCFPLPNPATFIPGCSTWEQVFDKSVKFKEWFCIDKKLMITVLPKPEKDLQVYFRLNCYTEFVAARQGAKVEGMLVSDSSEESEDEDGDFDIGVLMRGYGEDGGEGSGGTGSSSGSGISSGGDVVPRKKARRRKAPAKLVRCKEEPGQAQANKRKYLRRRRRKSTSSDSDSDDDSLLEEYSHQISRSSSESDEFSNSDSSDDDGGGCHDLPDPFGGNVSSDGVNHLGILPPKNQVVSSPSELRGGATGQLCGKNETDTGNGTGDGSGTDGEGKAEDIVKLRNRPTTGKKVDPTSEEPPLKMARADRPVKPDADQPTSHALRVEAPAVLRRKTASPKRTTDSTSSAEWNTHCLELWLAIVLNVSKLDTKKGAHHYNYPTDLKGRLLHVRAKLKDGLYDSPQQFLDDLQTALSFFKDLEVEEGVEGYTQIQDLKLIFSGTIPFLWVVP